MKRWERAALPLALPPDDPRTVTLVSRVALLGTRQGGLLWQSPAAVRIEEGNRTRTVPIGDRTRRAILTIVALGLLCVALAWLDRLRQRC